MTTANVAGNTNQTPAPGGGSMPATMGKYRILEVLGRGAYGTVYKAHDPTLDRHVAVKTILHRADVNDELMIEGFQREAKVAARLNHPRIVTVYEFGEEQGTLYLVMELLHGASLASVLRRRGLESFGQKLDILEQIADGVGFAHSQGLVHRDLKPGNIHVSPDGQAKILDFGLARNVLMQPGSQGYVEGTPQYMSPEQVRGQPVDARSDIFSLGCIFYEVLTYKRAFPADSVHAAMFQVMQREPEALRQIDSTVPKILESIIRKAMNKQRAERFQEASELRDSLLWVRKVISGETSEEQAIATLELTGDPVTATGSALLSGAIGTGIASGGISSSLSEPISGTATGPPSMAATVQDQTVRVTFVSEPGGGDRMVEIRNPGERSLLELANDHSVPIFHECSGSARCSTCRVRVVSGPSGLTPRTLGEKKLAARLGWGDDIRLSCQAQLIGDVSVQRLIRDAEDFGLLRFETRNAPPQESALAMLACGIQNFGDFVRRAEPYDIVHILNRYFLQIGEPVLTEGGIIERYLGEGLVAHFGHDGGSAQDKCAAAVRAGLRMMSRMNDFNRYVRSHFNAEFRFGVGLHFGRVIVGHVGHPSQMRVTTIGNATLPAAWLGGLRRASVGPLLGTEALMNIIEGELDIGKIYHEQGPDGSELAAYEIVDFNKPDSVSLVQQMFEKVQGARAEAAELFYRLLFEIDPSAEDLFMGLDMEEQGDKLMTMFGTIVDNLEMMDVVKESAENLGGRHVGYGVELHHYDAVEQALSETLRLLLGDAYTVDMRLAWSQVYNQLVQHMLNGASRVI